MKHDDVFHIENLSLVKLDLVNNLLENGWKLISVAKEAYLESPGFQEYRTTILIGASEKVFSNYKVSDAKAFLEKDSPF